MRLNVDSIDKASVCRRRKGKGDKLKGMAGRKGVERQKGRKEDNVEVDIGRKESRKFLFQM